MLNKNSIKYSFGVDENNKLLKTDFSIIENNKNLIEANMFVKNNKAFIDLKNLFNKVIVIDNDAFYNEFGININDCFEQDYAIENEDDIKSILKELKKLTNKTLNELNYTNEKVTTIIIDREEKTNKISLELNEENLKKIETIFLDGILNNNSLINELSKLLDLDNEMTKEIINMIKKDMYSYKESGIKLSIYTKGIIPNIVKIELEEKDKKHAYFVSNKKQNVLVININANDDVNGIIKYVTDNENNKIITIELDDKSNEMSFNLSIDINKKSDKEYQINILLTFNMQNYKLEIKDNLKVLIDSSIKIDNIKEEKNFKDINGEDINTIMENLTKAIKNSNLEKLVNMIYENTITKPMEKARKDAFLLEVNTLKRAASSATSLIIIGSVKDNYTKVENGYCFTAANLESLGLIENYEDFEGIITVRKGYNNEMSYEVEIANDLFYIKSDGDTSLDKVMSRSNIIAPIKTTCN